MARYRLNAKSYFDQGIKLADGGVGAGVQLEAGTEIDYDGVPGTNMDPLDDEAAAAMAKADKARIDGLRPLSKIQELILGDENPLQSAEQQRLSRQFREEQARDTETALGTIDVRRVEEPAPVQRTTLHAPTQGKPNR